MNFVGKKLAKYGINNIDLQLFAEGILLMQADVDVYKLIFEDESLDRNLLSIPNVTMFGNLKTSRIVCPFLHDDKKRSCNKLTMK
ncbi:hypothetical protein M3Y94_00111600 [Aphelenchoides besseyi]|nr:hypothetical protein M3Y94_00111600 [Aphelenchoides besseyi]